MKQLIKKTLIWGGSILGVLVVVLAIHIYIVTRPKAPDAQTRIMARIDVKQDINKDDANKITAWLYQQKGIDHVLCNSKTDIVVFTYSPLLADANDITSKFKSNFNYTHAIRYMPTKEEMQSGCPVASTSMTYKVYSFFKNNF